MQKKNEQLTVDQEDAKGKIIAMQTKMQKKAQQVGARHVDRGCIACCSPTHDGFTRSSGVLCC